VSATSTTRARLTTGAAATAVAGALSVVSLGYHGALRPLTVLLVVVGAATVLVGLVLARPSAGPVAAALLGAAFITTESGRGATIDPRTPLAAAALLLLAELLAWSAETPSSGIRIPAARRRLPRAAIVAAMTAGAWAATTALVAVVTLPFGRDLAVTAAGATAVAAVVAGLLGLAERRSGETPPA
jgi:hypothetical protein